MNFVLDPAFDVGSLQYQGDCLGEAKIKLIGRGPMKIELLCNAFRKLKILRTGIRISEYNC